MNSMENKDVGRVAPVIIFFILLFVFAKWGPAINFNTTSRAVGDAFVVTGEGKVYVTPDVAKITVGVQESGASLKTVQDNVNKKAEALTSAVKSLGIDKEDIKTTSYDLYPEYDYLTSSFNRIVGYRVSTSYAITIRDFDKINDVIMAATNAGANMEGNIGFELNDKTETEKLNEARELAVTNAKEKAEGLASAAGITLGRIINISESQGSNDIRPLYATGAGEASMDKTAATPSIEAGQTKIEMTVSLLYEVR